MFGLFFRASISFFLCVTLPSGVHGFSSEVKRHLNRSTVEIRETYGAPIATGFSVSDQGHVVTNYHVVQNRGNAFHAIFWNGQTRLCRLIAVDRSKDLALLQLEEPSVEHWISLDEGVSLGKGERVATCGFPQGGGKPIRYGEVESFSGRFETFTPGLRYVVTQLRLDTGMSGSPLVNRDGVLVGIHSSRESLRHSLSVPVKELFSFLRGCGWASDPVNGWSAPFDYM